jgi:predicted transcriptional regulator
VLYCLHMTTTTFSVRVRPSTKTRLEKLARSNGLSRAFIAAEAISAYLDTNEWQVASITKAVSSLESRQRHRARACQRLGRFPGDPKRTPLSSERMTLQWFPESIHDFIALRAHRRT